MTSLVSLLALSAVAQPANVTPEQAKKAVERSLPHLREEGVQWIRQRQCHSCHHVGFMIWSLNEANRLGFKVDMDELKMSSEWAIRYGTYDATFYQIKAPTLTALQKAGLAKGQVDKLKEVNKLFALQQDFREQLVGALTKEELGKHEETILKSAAIPAQGGKGEDADPKGMRGPGTVASELLLANAPALTAKEADGRKALVQRLVTTQNKDGSWTPGGQYNAFNRPPKENAEIVTAWNALALVAYADDANAKTREQALAYLKNAKPGISAEWYAVQALLARSLKETERADALLKDLRQLQMADGGWAWIKTNKQSDAYATGVALYALGQAGADHTDAYVAKAWSFLVKTQLADGDWLVPSGSLRKGGAKKTTDPIFSYWGTAWAALGMMQTLKAEK